MYVFVLEMTIIVGIDYYNVRNEYHYAWNDYH